MSRLTAFEAMYLIDLFKRLINRKFNLENGVSNYVITGSAYTTMLENFIKLEKKHPDWTFEDWNNFIIEKTQPKTKKS